jgi:hypothetical protein
LTSKSTLATLVRATHSAKMIVVSKECVMKKIMRNGVLTAFVVAASANLSAQDYLPGLSAVDIGNAQLNTNTIHVGGLVLQDQLKGDTVKSPRSTPRGIQPGVVDPAVAYAQLSFTSSVALQRQSMTNYANKFRRGNPEFAKTLDGMFSQIDFFGDAQKGLSAFGISTSNLADVYAVWMINMWSAAHSDISITPKSTFLAVRRQVASSLAKSTVIRSMSNSERQIMSDELLISAMVFAAGAEGFPPGSKEQKEYAKNMRIIARSSGFDVDAVTLTSNGFGPSKTR